MVLAGIAEPGESQTVRRRGRRIAQRHQGGNGRLMRYRNAPYEPGKIPVVREQSLAGTWRFQRDGSGQQYVDRQAAQCPVSDKDEIRRLRPRSLRRFQQRRIKFMGGRNIERRYIAQDRDSWIESLPQRVDAGGDAVRGRSVAENTIGPPAGSTQIKV